jgi:hypothetical protein
VTMLEFLIAGSLHGLEVGMPESRVRDIFGTADDYGRGLGGIRLLSYFDRGLQVACHEGKITLIGLYFNSPGLLRLGSTIGITIPFDSKTTIYDFTAYLQRNSIRWERVEGDSGSEGEILGVGRNVQAVFDDAVLISLLCC